MAKKKEGKAKFMHNGNRYVCYDCYMAFQVFGVLKGNRNRTPFCPNCGENHSVQKEKSTRIRNNPVKTGKRVRITWTAEENAVIDEVLKGKITPNQAHVKTGRPIDSIYKKLYRERRLLRDNEKNG